MMENMKIVDETTAYFLTEEQDAGTVVDENEGEILRLESDETEITFDQLDLLYFIYANEPVQEEQIKNEYDADEEKVKAVLEDLKYRGEVYTPQKGEYRVTPTQPDKPR